MSCVMGVCLPHAENALCEAILLTVPILVNTSTCKIPVSNLFAIRGRQIRFPGSLFFCFLVVSKQCCQLPSKESSYWLF